MGGVAVIAALYVERGGVYYDLPDVEPWGLPERDARLYAGPWPVVAHPPCARWGSYWYGGPLLHKQGRRKQLGDDDGCFAAALHAVETWGGVLEHPAESRAWSWHGIAKPPRDGGWVEAGLWHPGWTCCVEQGHYGHRARKATWLYVAGCRPHELRWGSSGQRLRMDAGFHTAAERTRHKLAVSDMWHSKAERDRAIRTGMCQMLSHRERAATPVEFRDLLLGIAALVERGKE